MNIIYGLDLIGTFAFAISEALVVSKKDFDLFGAIRDILTNQVPTIFIKKYMLLLVC